MSDIQRLMKEKIVHLVPAAPDVIARGFERVNAPSWSPDGATIAFAARDGDYEIYVVDID